MTPAVVVRVLDAFNNSATGTVTLISVRFW